MLFNARAAKLTNKWQIAFSDDMNRSMKLAMRMSTWYFRGRKLNIFWHSITISTELVRNNSMKNESMGNQTILSSNYGIPFTSGVTTAILIWLLYTSERMYLLFPTDSWKPHGKCPIRFGDPGGVSFAPQPLTKQKQPAVWGSMISVSPRGFKEFLASNLGFDSLYAKIMSCYMC